MSRPTEFTPSRSDSTESYARASSLSDVTAPHTAGGISHEDSTGIEIRTHIGRSTMVESIHRANAVAVPADGPALLFGAEDRGTFLRSVAKPFQTLALFRSGVIEHHGFTDEEVAVVTASHGGEPVHRRWVEGILKRGGFTTEDLRCGAHAPFTASDHMNRCICADRIHWN